MFKRFFVFLSVLLIGFQIPLIVLLSGAQIVSSRIAELEVGITETAQEAVEKIAEPVKIVGGFMGMMKEEVPALPVAAIAVKERIKGKVSSILAEGQENVAEVKELLGQITNSMYISIAITLLLIILLVLLNIGAFFWNFGAAFILGGILTLLNAIALYYFFILHFDATFSYFYQMATSETFALGIPFVSSFIKSFAKDFVFSLVNLLIVRSAFVGVIVLGMGIVSLFLHRMFVAGPRHRFTL